MLLRTSPEVVALRPRACDEQELSWCQLGDGHLSKDSPSGRQHVADVGHAHLKTKKANKKEKLLKIKAAFFFFFCLKYRIAFDTVHKDSSEVLNNVILILTVISPRFSLQYDGYVTKYVCPRS